MSEPDEVVDEFEGEIQHGEPRSDVMSDTSTVILGHPETDTVSIDGVSEGGEDMQGKSPQHQESHLVVATRTTGGVRKS